MIKRRKQLGQLKIFYSPINVIAFVALAFDVVSLLFSCVHNVSRSPFIMTSDILTHVGYSSLICNCALQNKLF